MCILIKKWDITQPNPYFIAGTDLNSNHAHTLFLTHTHTLPGYHAGIYFYTYVQPHKDTHAYNRSYDWYTHLLDDFHRYYNGNFTKDCI